MCSMDNTLLVTKIERSAIHDGPGIRTVVFLQGCPLHCAWCCNPETQPLRPVPLHDAQKCVGCGACAAVCVNGAPRLTDGLMQFDRARCKACGACVSVCPTGAVTLSGRAMSVTDVLTEVHGDDAYYRVTGGGMTLSGGEPLLQEAAISLLSQAKAEGLSTFVETTACVAWETLCAAAAVTDGFYVDYKHSDAAALYRATGAYLPAVRANIKRLVKAHGNVTLRTPVIPGFNDSEETLSACFDFALQLGLSEYVLLPYHALGKRKYELMRVPYAFDAARTLTAEDMRPFESLGERMGLHVRIGG